MAAVKTNLEWRLSPAFIELLIHINAYPRPLDNPDAPVTKEGLCLMLHHSLIKEDPGRPSGYWTTERGRALIDMLCSTPLPEKRYVDPRTSSIIE